MRAPLSTYTRWWERVVAEMLRQGRVVPQRDEATFAAFLRGDEPTTFATQVTHGS